MPDERRDEHRERDGRDPNQDSHSPARETGPTSPPFLNDGLELPRDSHC
jgi:hypothetical protein